MEPNEAQKTESTFFETLEKIFFGLFLFSIPLQTRLTFVTQETYGYGFFNEYATFFLYLSDILFIITFFLFFVNPSPRQTFFSLGHFPQAFYNYFKIFSYSTNSAKTGDGLTKKVNFSKISKTKLSTYPLLIPLLALFLLIAWGFLSIYWSAYKEISFYKSLKLAEFSLLFLYIAQRLRWFGLTKFLSIIFVAGFFQSIISIFQYLYQHSLGLKLLGESILAPNIDNVAKIVVDGEKLIRAYGTFPHPNVFTGFLILSIFSGFWLLFTAKIEKNGLLWISILTAGITLQLMALVLSFSRVGWLAILLALIILLLSNTQLFHACPPNPRHFLEKLFNLKQNSVIVSRETICDKAKEGETTLAFFHSNKAKISALAVIFISFSLFLALNRSVIASRTIDFGQNYQQTIGHRTLYNNIAIKMIKDQPLTGLGNGNFTLKMKDYSPITLEWWQYQPVHNIYLLINSELGIVGLILFLVFVFSVLKMAYLKHKTHIVSCETILFNRLMFAIFIGFLFIGLFDHYFWTLQQGQLTFWLVLGVLTASVKPRPGE